MKNNLAIWSHWDYVGQNVCVGFPEWSLTPDFASKRNLAKATIF